MNLSGKIEGVYVMHRPIEIAAVTGLVLGLALITTRVATAQEEEIKTVTEKQCEDGKGNTLDPPAGVIADRCIGGQYDGAYVEG